MASVVQARLECGTQLGSSRSGSQPCEFTQHPTATRAVRDFRERHPAWYGEAMPGKRTPRQWMLYEGGPFNGERWLLSIGKRPGDELVRYLPSPTAGMNTPHRHVITQERRTVVDGPWKVPCYVVKYDRAMPDVPYTPPPLYVQPMQDGAKKPPQ